MRSLHKVRHRCLGLEAYRHKEVDPPEGSSDWLYLRGICQKTLNFTQKCKTPYCHKKSSVPLQDGGWWGFYTGPFTW